MPKPKHKNSFAFGPHPLNQDWAVVRSNPANKSFERLPVPVQAKVLELEALLKAAGPYVKELPEGCALRQTKAGQAKGSIFHAHINAANGTTYTIEWEIVSKNERKITIPNMGSHENYSYKARPYTKNQLKGMGLSWEAPPENKM